MQKVVLTNKQSAELVQMIELLMHTCVSILREPGIASVYSSNSDSCIFVELDSSSKSIKIEVSPDFNKVLKCSGIDNLKDYQVKDILVSLKSSLSKILNKFKSPIYEISFPIPTTKDTYGFIQVSDKEEGSYHIVLR